MTTKWICTFKVGNKEAKIYLNSKEDYFFVDYYENGSIIGDEHYPNKSFAWVKECVENWFNGVKKTVDGD